eukprot:CAMPEP_0170160304 /NCGR_PEP_ID=MMETSP0033_2-20121228/73105_1 /TAXON_ID=195969 /ORGANISM="Dolichomastix tenuilepis, Strain CCMP3274" /LENGTH=412 /DNA_ID=CAMNT_0010397841 /DNA_START=1 /DNA_END=1236 /DNA_ORIENTATION=+
MPRTAGAGTTAVNQPPPTLELEKPGEREEDELLNQEEESSAAVFPAKRPQWQHSWVVIFGFALALVMGAGIGLAVGVAARGDTSQASDDALRRVLHNSEVRVGVAADYAPFAAEVRFEGKEEIVGSDVDIVSSVSRDLGVRVRFVRTTWSQLEGDLLAERFDVAIGGVTETSERRAAGIAFGSIIKRGGKALVRRCDDDDGSSGADGVLRLAVNAGGTNELVAKQLFPEVALTIVSSNGAQFELLRKGDVDAVLTDAVEGDLEAAKRHPLRLCRGALLTSDDKAFAYSARSGRALRALVDRWLASHAPEAAVDASIRAWSGVFAGEPEDALIAVSRIRIDACDARLLTALAERAEAVEAVGRDKARRGLNASVPARERAVLERLKRRAQALEAETGRKRVPNATVDAVWSTI